MTLEHGVARTRSGFVSRLREALGRPLDDDTWDEIEEALIGADLGAALAARVVEGARARRDLEPETAVKNELVGLFALFHGHAHGTELPGFAHPAAYGAGFVAATALLHAGGVAIAFLVRRHAARLPLRIAGAAMAAVGGGLLLGA